jgi:hypothetical protein
MTSAVTVTKVTTKAIALSRCAFGMNDKVSILISCLGSWLIREWLEIVKQSAPSHSRSNLVDAGCH